jgi:hypothetical protein
VLYLGVAHFDDIRHYYAVSWPCVVDLSGGGDFVVNLTLGNLREKYHSLFTMMGCYAEPTVTRIDGLYDRTDIALP